MAARKRKAVDDGMDQDDKAPSKSSRVASTPPLPSTVPARRPDSYYRNLYTREPDFQLLAKRAAEFGALYVRHLRPIR